MKAAKGQGKYAIVEGLKPIVSPVESLSALENAVALIKDLDTKEQALVAIDIFKTAEKLNQQASA